MISTILPHSDLASTVDLLAAWIEAQMAYQGVPGLSIGIVYDQEVIWARGFGYANLAPTASYSSLKWIKREQCSG